MTYHCITCSDEGIPMLVVSLVQEFDSAICKAADGEEQEVMTGLLIDVSVDDLLLVHAGTAIAKITPASAEQCRAS